MRSRSWSRLGWGLAAVLGLAGCSGGAPVDPSDASPPAAGDELTAYVVNYPLQYFAQRIGGELVSVEFPGPVDEDPAFWSPDAATVSAYQQADRILLNGAGYAHWVQRVTLPASKLIDTSAGFRERYVKTEDSMTHAHGPGGEHTHGEVAFTTWLDPILAIEQADAIRQSFADVRPEAAAAFAAGFEALRGDLTRLDEQLEAATAGLSGLPLLASHPVYQYFARRYGLDLRSVHFEPDELPDESSWSELADLLRDHPAEWMLWEAEPLAATRARLSEMGVTSVVVDPCSTPRQGADYLEVMQANRQRLETIGSKPR